MKIKLYFHLTLIINGKFKRHYSIRSSHNIHIDQWKRVLREWAEENAIHLKEYKKENRG